MAWPLVARISGPCKFLFKTDILANFDEISTCPIDSFARTIRGKQGITAYAKEPLLFFDPLKYSGKRVQVKVIVANFLVFGHQHWNALPIA